MKSIAFYHPVDDRYGASNILAYIISFVEKGYVCDIYVPKLTGAIKNTISECDLQNVNFIELDYLPLAHRGMFNLRGLIGWCFQNIKLLKKIIKDKGKYDLVYINTLSLFSLSLLCRLTGKKNLVHCHEFLAGNFFGAVMKWGVSVGANSVISVSKHVHSYISDGSKKYKVIHNGIPDLLLPQGTMAEKSKSSFIDIAFVGRIMPEKGHWFLVKALELLSPSFRDKIKINVYGDAPPLRPELYKELTDLIEEKGLTDTFIFHGFCKEASIKVANSDLCLIPSMMADPFPTTVLESMRSSKTCIVTNHGGAAEIIDDKINGFLISPNNEQEFSILLSDIATGKYDLAAMGRNARLIFESKLTLEIYKNKMSEHLSSLI
jgi:glycosyltransferase involved in cell wall biosynthesis